MSRGSVAVCSLVHWNVTHLFSWSESSRALDDNGGARGSTPEAQENGDYIGYSETYSYWEACQSGFPLTGSRCPNMQTIFVGFVIFMNEIRQTIHCQCVVY